jgi:hypothetical protein
LVEGSTPSRPTNPPLLQRFDHFPEELLEIPACELWRQLRGPALFDIAGRRPDPLFVSVLLHGNEDSGWQAIQAVLRRHRGNPLPRRLLLFVGNVAAARERLRSLPGQQDYNRAWPGTTQPGTATARLLREVFDLVASQAPFASIDLHNNTGRNPHYACVSRLDERHLHLARLFSRTVVYFERPAGVQSAALAQLCPAVVAECGRAGESAGIEHATQLVEAGLALTHFPEHPVPDHDLDLLRTMAIVRVPAQASMSFDGEAADFQFRPDLDSLNFSELDRGAHLGSLGAGCGERLEVAPTHELAPRDGYISYEAGVIRLARPAVPAMLTLDQRAVRLDCLGYLMQRIDRDGRPASGAGSTP